MKIVTAEKLREIDRFCIESLKIPSMVLMENAALKVLKNIEYDNINSAAIVCGTGNNGGDGLALARHLCVLGKKTEIFLIGDISKLSEDCKLNYEILLNMNVNINNITNIEDVSRMKKNIRQCDIIIDAIFGTGLCREIKGIYEDVILLINNSGTYVISIDIPSGLNANTGEILGCCIKANKTISFQFYKRGFLKYGIHELTGKIIIEEIGIPNFVVDKFKINDYILDNKDINKIIPKRKKYSHKGDFGRVSIVAGSAGFTGAAYISTQSAVRSGAGLVTLCCSEIIQKIMSNKFIEAMTVSFKEKEKLNGILNKSDVIAVGPGMGNNKGTLKIVSDIIKLTKAPIVIDADGINVLKDNLDVLKEKNNKIILTPHLGEMSRITQIPIDKIKRNRIEISKQFAKEYDVILLLKGFNTLITNGESVVVNSTGNSAMASGGMGDCLTGMIASFIGQGIEPFKAAYVAAYIHGMCGDKLSKKMYCVNADHIIEELPYVIKELQR
ncbi:NAD(P)H-hydrate dehydratase [Clostridium aestuarii]|uniref:Bifunctional NAD(P)H-hydrate repair enzyme n=1 Tax=Clostridium aestuarii TaxID=338193 RepID=A0ABT4CWI3_9CLOT|nr:NAD(P)H-hydrate dehydratase [Clostridium aestuarii]MCY6483316.1 NAD(P)H-hydrate dehydratase [Clostridium aestuarii]